MQSGRADPISRQGGWEQTCIGMTSTLTRRGVERHVSWRDPCQNEHCARDLEDQFTQCASYFANAVSIWRCSGLWQPVFDTFDGVSL
jgi:hypothetical protein